MVEKQNKIQHQKQVNYLIDSLDTDRALEEIGEYFLGATPSIIQ